MLLLYLLASWIFSLVKCLALSFSHLKIFFNFFFLINSCLYLLSINPFFCLFKILSQLDTFLLALSMSCFSIHIFQFFSSHKVCYLFSFMVFGIWRDFLFASGAFIDAFCFMGGTSSKRKAFVRHYVGAHLFFHRGVHLMWNNPECAKVSRVKHVQPLPGLPSSLCGNVCSTGVQAPPVFPQLWQVSW